MSDSIIQIVDLNGRKIISKQATLNGLAQP